MPTTSAIHQQEVPYSYSSAAGNQLLGTITLASSQALLVIRLDIIHMHSDVFV